jgi:hypothetical protein
MDDNRIGDQVSYIANEAKGRMATAAETVNDLAGKAAEAGSTLRDAAIETGKQVGDAATKTYRQGLRASEYVSQNTAEQPLLALLLAGAVGFGIAYWMYRR